MTPRASKDIDYSSESRNQKFRRLAEQRINKVLNDLRILGNLSSRSRYDYTQEEVDQMFEAIDTRLAEVKAKFSRSKNPEEDESFRFRPAPTPVVGHEAEFGGSTHAQQFN